MFFFLEIQLKEEVDNLNFILNEGITNNIIEWIKNFFAKAVKFFKDIFSAIVNFFKNLKDKIKDFFIKREEDGDRSEKKEKLKKKVENAKVETQEMKEKVEDIKGEMNHIKKQASNYSPDRKKEAKEKYKKLEERKKSYDEKIKENEKKIEKAENFIKASSKGVAEITGINMMSPFNYSAYSKKLLELYNVVSIKRILSEVNREIKDLITDYEREGSVGDSLKAGAVFLKVSFKPQDLLEKFKEFDSEVENLEKRFEQDKEGSNILTLKFLEDNLKGRAKVLSDIETTNKKFSEVVTDEYIDSSVNSGLDKLFMDVLKMDNITDSVVEDVHTFVGATIRETHGRVRKLQNMAIKLLKNYKSDIDKITTAINSIS